MLSVAKLARGREGYYLATLASGREQTGGLIEPDGRWLGGAAAALGLSGTVEGAALRALFSGVDPTTGELLAHRHARVRVAAYDCTYSTPKSVSLLHALGPKEVRDHVRAGHEEAAGAALGYLERRGARVRRSPSRGEPTESVPASGFVAAAFLHRTSRAPDPHLHSHVLVANLAQGPDGRWSALDGRGIYLELGAARDLYETQLRSELTRRLGVSWRELQGSWADLGGIDPNVVRAFSRRSAEIAAALEQSGLTGPGARRLAAVRTRPEKDLGTPYEELVSEWRERAYRLGVSDTRLAAVSGRTGTGSAISPSGSASAGVPEPGAGPRPEGSPQEPWAERALGERGVAARDGTFRRGDLVRARCATLPSGAPVGDVERDVDAVVAEGRVVPVPGAAGRPGLTLKAPSSPRPIPAGIAEPIYTTPELLALQERMGKLVQDRPGAVELLAYRPGDRLAALDSLGRLLSGPQAQIAAVAPARNAAASFEAVTGIETTPVAALRRTAAAPVPGPAEAGVLVLAEAHRLGPWELSAMLESATASMRRVVLFAPAASLEASLGPAAVLAPHLGAFVPPRLERGAASVESRPSGWESHLFAGREVLVVGDGPEAREAALLSWAAAREAGERCLVVASDDSVVRSLRDAVRNAGGGPEEVVEGRHLAGGAAPRHDGPVVAVGSVPTRVRQAASRFVQVAIAPVHRDPQERLGVAAEVARPRYLVSELGAARSLPDERASWRRGAVAIETFRRRWSIDDPEHALGDRRTMRQLDGAALADAALTRLEVRRATTSVERSAPGSRRRSPETMGRSR